MERILQCYTSMSLHFFEAAFLNKWGLNRYVSLTDPAVFFGVYNEMDYARIASHQAKAIVVWGGSDTLAPTEKLARLKLPNVKHISGSKWITDDLAKAGIESEYIPVSCFDKKLDEFVAYPLGKNIYVYTAEGHSAYFYGKDIYARLMEKYGTGIFYIATAKSYSKNELYTKVYPSCFVGLRLVNHDGLSETVSELGLFGRKTIYNGCEPNALNYKSINDVIDHIENEKKYIGEKYSEISDQMKKFLNIGIDWLYI